MDEGAGWKEAGLEIGISREVFHQTTNGRRHGKNRANTLTGSTKQIGSKRCDSRSYTRSLCGEHGWWRVSIHLREKRG